LEKTDLNCPLCGHMARRKEHDGQTIAVDCRRCGRFRVAVQLLESLAADGRLAHARHLISGSLRDALSAGSELPRLTTEIVEQSLLPLAPRTMNERLRRLLTNLSRMLTDPSSECRLQPEDDYPLAYCGPNDYLGYYLDALAGMGLVECRKNADGRLDVKITPRGWQSLEEDIGPSIGSRTAFVALSFADHMTPAADEGLKPGIRAAGYEPVIMREVEHVQLVTDRMLGEIRSARFVVADFTEQKHGVCFEAGFALGLGIPVIWTCRQDDIANLHFDIKQYNHINWSDPRDLRARLTHRIRALIGQGPLAP